ncbi:MAG: hypothetical protein H6565_16345 [Lewinellaceae bacterium]|nr:hypothetical protein [Lewinellaceae bacterium]
MKNLLSLFLSALIPVFMGAQVTVHEAVLFVDDNNTANGFPPSAMINNIQEHLDKLLADKGEKVNVLILSQECPRLEYVLIDGAGYWIGPDYNGSNVWCKADDPKSKVIQILPGDGLSYNTGSYMAFSSGNTSNGIWQGLKFNQPWQPHNTKYYCLVHEILNRIYGDNCPVESLEDCEAEMVAQLDNSIIHPNLYLDGQSLDQPEIQGALRQAKSVFCTNLLFYSKYLHTRDVDAADLEQQILNTVGGDYVLVVATPKEKDGGDNLYSQVQVQFGKGSVPPPENCFPTSRTLTTTDEDAFINRLINDDSESSLSNVKTGIGYLLDYVLTADQDPVPGGVTGCDYGQAGGNGNNSYLRVNFPQYNFFGSSLSSPGENAHVKWYNNFSESGNDVVTACSEAAHSAANAGVDLQYFVASGCGTNNDQFANSRQDFDQETPVGSGGAIWMYYDKCSDRMFYDIKLSDGFASEINPEFGITNPDSIRAINAAVEEMLERTFSEVSKMDEFESVTLDLAEYPTNFGFLSPGFIETCGPEDPWHFGLRYQVGNYKDLAIYIVSEGFVVTGQMIKNQEFPKRAWLPFPQDSCLFDFPGGAIGLINGGLDQIEGKTWALIGIINLCTELWGANGNTRKAMLKQLANPLDLIFGQYTESVNCLQTAECLEERNCCSFRILTNVVFDVLLGQGLISMAGNLSNVGKKVDEKLGMFIPDFSDKYNKWKRTLGEGKHREHDTFLGSLEEKVQLKLAKHASLSKIWEQVSDGLIPGVSLQRYKEFLGKLPSHTNEDFYFHFENVFTPENANFNPAKIAAFMDDVDSKPLDHFLDQFGFSPNKYLNAWSEAFEGGLVHMRTKIKFLDDIDDFRSGEVGVHFKDYGCSIAEHGLIRFYTSEYHIGLNAALRGDAPMTPEYSEFTSKLNMALDKLPNHNGKVIRGCKKGESDVMKTWQVGEEKTMDSFYSTSTELDVAKGFCAPDGDVLVYIEPSKTGKNIDPISHFNEKALEGQEFEVLYKTKKQFKVIYSGPDPDNPGYYKVTLVEVGD